MVKNFRPISLIGSLYKIIAKILANRLVVVLGDIVNEVQSAFVADRQILDGPFIFNEVLQWCKLKKKHSFILKIDFEKAYDSVQWDYLDDVLRKFGFGEKGLSINLSKSKLLGVVVSEDRVVQAAYRIGCGVLKALFAYLGSKVRGNMYQIKSWDEIVDKMVDRLSKWKMKTLSIGGRLTILKAVLGSMPIYHISIFKVPMKVLQRMESIRSRVFSGVDLNSKKSIWVKWSKVLCSKEKGDLGVSSLYALNRAFMCKWVWRFTTQKNLLWTRVIKAIHGEYGKNGSGFKVGYKSIWRIAFSRRWKH
ncbi:RNA-directed DNA polymerase, eukaryota, reverse transcriptase zinc-binding domain protein [Tanacetum coccineum]